MTSLSRRRGPSATSALALLSLFACTESAPSGGIPPLPSLPDALPTPEATAACEHACAPHLACDPDDHYAICTGDCVSFVDPGWAADPACGDAWLAYYTCASADVCDENTAACLAEANAASDTCAAASPSICVDACAQFHACDGEPGSVEVCEMECLFDLLAASAEGEACLQAEVDSVVCYGTLSCEELADDAEDPCPAPPEDC